MLHYSTPISANVLSYFGSNEGNYLGHLYLRIYNSSLLEII